MNQQVFWLHVSAPVTGVCAWVSSVLLPQLVYGKFHLQHASWPDTRKSLKACLAGSYLCPFDTLLPLMYRYLQQNTQCQQPLTGGSSPACA
jgi:hypothetical protein